MAMIIEGFHTIDLVNLNWVLINRIAVAVDQKLSKEPMV